MLSKSSVLPLIAVLAFAGCAAKTSPNFQTQPAPKIEKGTKTTPQISSQSDQILLAFNELNWARQNGALAVFPVSVSTQEGCVIRRPMKSGGYILREDYACQRTSDESDSAAGLRYVLSGMNLFTSASGLYQINGSFASETWSNQTLVSRGAWVRQTQISLPGGAVGTTQVNDAELKSSVFKITSKTEYRGQAAEDRDAETLNANMTGGFVFSAAKPLTILTGTQLTLSYLAESDKGTKRSAQIIQLTALSDISYAENDGCLRPVGRFALSVGSTQVGTLTTEAQGYTLSTETNKLHVWGKRCIER